MVLKGHQKKHWCSSSLEPVGEKLQPVVSGLRNQEVNMEAPDQKFSSDCIGAILDLVSSPSWIYEL